MDNKLLNIESPTIKRTILLDCLMRKNISLDTQYKIALLINNSNNREVKAEELTNIINSCKTEEEVVEKINNLNSIE